MSHRAVRVADDIMKACKIQLENVDRAPKFDFDDADLLPEDRDVLEQIARCVTTGPLKGRGLGLVGRCDQRGEVEYNMVLGEYRADSVHDYLAKLGVDPLAMASRRAASSTRKARTKTAGCATAASTSLSSRAPRRAA